MLIRTLFRRRSLTPRRHRSRHAFSAAPCEMLQVRELLSADPLADISSLSDEFDDPNSITDWQRVNQVEGWNADQLQLWNVDQTQPGRMVMQPQTVVWYEDWRGPMVFKEVAGDFAFTTEVQITDRDELSALDAEHGFWSDGNYYTNYLGQNERWIRDADNVWHYLLPNGDLYRWEGSFGASPRIAELGSDVYADPSRLTDPQPAAVTATIENGVLTVTAAAGYTGTVQVRVVVSDGFTSVATTIHVTVLANDDLDAVFAASSGEELLAV